MAKEQFDNGGLGLNSLDDFAGMNPSDMEELIKHAMEDPEMKEIMNSLNYDLGSAMQELADLTPEKLAEQMQEAVNLFTSDSYFESALQNQEEILKNLEASGMVSEEDLEEFRANPTKLEEEMKAAVEQMKELFSDPEALGTAAQIAQGLTGLLTDPEKLAEAMAELSNELTNDDKIEEARLQLLSNPDLAGNPDLAELFGSSEMKEILNDPVVWRESVKKGKNMMFNGVDGAKAEL